jgi:hypothetical protein
MQQGDLEKMEHFLDKISLQVKLIFKENLQDMKICLKENLINS